MKFKLNSAVADSQIPELLEEATGIMRSHFSGDAAALAGFEQWLRGDGADLPERERLEWIVGAGMTLEQQTQGVFVLDLGQWSSSPSEVLGGVPPLEWARRLDEIAFDERLRDRPPSVERIG